MIRSDQILKTVEMIQKEHLDVRTVTMGISLLDCRASDAETTAQNIEDKIRRLAGNFVETCDRFGSKYGIPVVNKRISVTPVAHVGAGFSADGFVRLAKALDHAASEVGIDIIGGFSANVEKGISKGDAALIEAIPEALATTGKVCSSINAGSTRHGLNMDAVALLGPDRAGSGRSQQGSERFRRRQVCGLFKPARRQSIYGRSDSRSRRAGSSD